MSLGSLAWKVHLHVYRALLKRIAFQAHRAADHAVRGIGYLAANASSAQRGNIALPATQHPAQHATQEISVWPGLVFVLLVPPVATVQQVRRAAACAKQATMYMAPLATRAPLEGSAQTSILHLARHVLLELTVFRARLNVKRVELGVTVPKMHLPVEYAHQEIMCLVRLASTVPLECTAPRQMLCPALLARRELTACKVLPFALTALQGVTALLVHPAVHHAQRVILFQVLLVLHAQPGVTAQI